MSRSFPFLQRRGLTLNFRIAVPQDLRAAVGLSEITRGLGTGDKHRAGPLALLYAASIKQSFAQLRAAIQDMDFDKLKHSVDVAKLKVRIADVKDEHEAEVDQLREQHRAQLARVRLEVANASMKDALALRTPAAGVAPLTPPPGPIPASAPAMPVGAVAPPARALAPSPDLMLSKVVDEFLLTFSKKKVAMFSKHNTVLPLLLSVVGDKPVGALRQGDLNRFFGVVLRLPPRWHDECRKLGITALELAAKEHPLTLGPKTFDDSYKASVRAFLKAARVRWQDEGFPTTLTTEGIDYEGDRTEGDDAQRAFRQDELVRLFQGPEMAAFAEDPTLAHQFWLPSVGLYTGARVNELCQLNPQTDIAKDAESGIWYLRITPKQESDDRIRKSTKTGTTRDVPIHSKLLALGFLEYVERVRGTGSRLLFPAWAPSRGRASPLAESWFRQFLRDLGLRDETPGARIVGMHAFRSTLLNRAHNARPRLDATAITGHAGGIDPVVRGYQGDLNLVNMQAVLEAIPFGL